MQQPQAVLGEQYRSKYARDYTVQPKLWSWSGATATILDDQGSLAFSVDGQAWALRGDRVLTNALGNPVCALQAKVGPFANQYSPLVAPPSAISGIAWHLQQNCQWH